ncbi:hypothetical protein HQ346_15630 [Rhodococcus sp. BP-252]|nr:hypothetical protein [Rhodococcus sp. BP-320]MBY6417730.1 hypothetical protein [Rhodococcus sp. BP-321]MBY6423880.1 hypothetical protein [Rhodococcus sp. BP-324]MBY6427849.1 hypothetical protein [Rhodococcus sp. BP-323]MBY6431848.1 hypothetical protein [Rhodococcus sp. BP-322]MBY6441956.1 hypothetical protein [Rhodococcus sp. BP-319]MBY6446824.1 hypothetical protein [Rhodococcus sp. BP-318]MBY6451622.1 hypothetical protein [Rhodococcus sp. BP-315]MBY6456399.1 hypothetical protein [Rhodoc
MTGPRRRPRERVVLAGRRGARMVRTRVEVQEQTEVGDAMVRGLVRAQLLLSVRLALLTLAVLFAIPLVSLVVPAFADATLFGIRLPWLVLGVAVYPLLLVVGWVYVRQADRNEHEFVDLVDD